MRSMLIWPDFDSLVYHKLIVVFAVVLNQNNSGYGRPPHFHLNTNAKASSNIANISIIITFVHHDCIL